MMNRNADLTNSALKTALDSGRDEHGCFLPGNSNRLVPGQSGNPKGRSSGASFAAALSRQALKPVADREEMAKIARSIGLDPEQAQNIDVVAALFYAALSRSLLRAATGNGRSDDKLVGMLQVLLKALDPSELHVSGPDGGPIPIAAVVANVQMALGIRPNPDARQRGGCVRMSERDAKNVSLFLRATFVRGRSRSL